MVGSRAISRGLHDADTDAAESTDEEEEDGIVFPGRMATYFQRAVLLHKDVRNYRCAKFRDEFNVDLTNFHDAELGVLDSRLVTR